MINNWLISGDNESINNYYNFKNKPEMFELGMNLDALNLSNQTALELAQDNVIRAFKEYNNNLIGSSSESNNFVNLESVAILAPIIESI